MALSIISNQAASIAARQLEQANSAATDSAEKLSSGKRVNSAKDDAAASAIAARLSSEVAGLRQAGVNAGQASSMLQIADGAFQNVEDILTRAKSLAVQAGSDNISNTERGFLDQEFQALKNEIERISKDTEFNGNKLVDGTIDTGTAMAGGTVRVALRGLAGEGLTTSVTSNNLTVQTGGTVTASIKDGTNTVMFTGTFDRTAMAGGNTGPAAGQALALMADMGGGTLLVAVEGTLTASITSATPLGTGTITGATNGNGTATTGADVTFKVGTGTDEAADEITVKVSSVSVASLGLTDANITTADKADNASAKVSAAIDALQGARSEVGASQNRLDFANENVSLSRENQEAARSELEDLNVAREITQFSQKQLLVQAGTSTLSQANNLPQNLLQLFQ